MFSDKLFKKVIIARPLSRGVIHHSRPGARFRNAETQTSESSVCPVKLSDCAHGPEDGTFISEEPRRSLFRSRFDVSKCKWIFNISPIFGASAQTI